MTALQFSVSDRENDVIFHLTNMAVDLFHFDWQSEYKHRGATNYERKAHFRELRVKERGIWRFDDPPGSSTNTVHHSVSIERKYVRRGKNNREEEDDDSFYEIRSESEPAKRKLPVIVYVLTKSNQVRWGRRGREGYIHVKDESSELPDDSEESDTDAEDNESVRRWPEPAKHKGGRPYAKPSGRLARQLHIDKHVRTKEIKRKDWREQFSDEDYTKYCRNKKYSQATYSKISIIVTNKFKSARSQRRAQQRAQKRKHEKKDFEQIRAERRSQKEARESMEVIAPSFGDSIDADEDLSAKAEHSGDTPTTDRQVHVSKSSKEKEAKPDEQEDGRVLLIKLLRESTRPDTLHTEFRQDYREGACKPRRFVINISRLVFHHVTLMNRLRLKAIPKLDLTTYLVFAYCRESTQGVDLYRVQVASKWADSGKGILAHFKRVSNGNVTQIQELIQCVISAIDSVDLRRLVAKANRRKKKNIQFGNRPTCNFSMLLSVAKWELSNTSLPRASEWNSYGDAQDKPHTFYGFHNVRQIFEHHRNNVNSNNVKKFGPSDPGICGGCLVEADINGNNNLMALDACSHWFCEQCWKSRLFRQIKKAGGSQEGIASCVEEGCDGSADPITLLTLLSVEKIRSIIEGKIRSQVALMAPRVVICPNESCRQIFSVLGGNSVRTSEMAIPIVCQCSYQFCSKCLGSPHWPASCEYSTRYKEIMKQRKDNILFSKLLLDNELPDDLLSGRKCFNCGRFVRQFVFRKTEPKEFGRPVCLQCAREDNHNNNLQQNGILNSNQSRNNKINNVNIAGVESNITKWYKIASIHRKMRHPEVVKALYTMAEAVADKLVCAVTAGKYVGDATRAATEWDDSLLEWAEESYNELCKSQCDAPTEDSGVSSTGKHTLSESIEPSIRTTSASSNCSSKSLTQSTMILPSENSIALSKLSTLDGNEASELPASMTRAACNIVQLKLELHQIAEYVAVLLDYQVELRGKLIRCLERSEDLCSSLGILLHDPHVHNAARIIPTFMRLRTQAKQVIENIYNEICSVNLEGKLA